MFVFLAFLRTRSIASIPKEGDKGELVQKADEVIYAFVKVLERRAKGQANEVVARRVE